ncbi:MAG TPA: hypothetical protein VGI03_02115 [Verrucomicrobiae bacterium]|jgi:hypothetical protein
MNAPLHMTGKMKAKGSAMNAKPGMKQKSGDTEMFLREIQNRAETITPVLKQLLDFHPTQHWKA